MGSCQVLPRTRVRSGALVRAACLALVLVPALAGCGRGQRRVPELQFETESDTTGLSHGPAILTSFDPVRYPNGLLQLRGGLRFPDGTRVQISLYRPGDDRPVQRVQVSVANGRFESAPLLGDRGPLPVATYRVEFLAHFNPAWQPAGVLDATRDGRDLRGPGMTRGTLEAAFLLNREQRI